MMKRLLGQRLLELCRLLKVPVGISSLNQQVRGFGLQTLLWLLWTEILFHGHRFRLVLNMDFPHVLLFLLMRTGLINPQHGRRGTLIFMNLLIGRTLIVIDLQVHGWLLLDCVVHILRGWHLLFIVE